MSRKDMIEGFMTDYPDLTDSELAEKIAEDTGVSVKKKTLRRDIRRVKAFRQDRERYLQPLRKEIEELKGEREYLLEKCKEERQKRVKAEKKVERLESQLEETGGGGETSWVRKLLR